jgi:hypothetical protein
VFGILGWERVCHSISVRPGHFGNGCIVGLWVLLGINQELYCALISCRGGEVLRIWVAGGVEYFGIPSGRT